MRKYISSVVVIFILVGCNNNVVFKEYNAFENVSWNKRDVLDFDFQVQKSESLDFYLAIRHHTNFPFSFIKVNVTLFTPDGEMRSRDYHFRLKNRESKWLGDGMGELWDIELPIRKDMIFNKSGMCKVSIENKMDKVETPGLIEVGLIVKKSD